eukprot:scaffold86336_cov63-Phaeocystis_antarctica.AAC.1
MANTRAWKASLSERRSAAIAWSGPRFGSELREGRLDSSKTLLPWSWKHRWNALITAPICRLVGCSSGGSSRGWQIGAIGAPVIGLMPHELWWKLSRWSSRWVRVSSRTCRFSAVTLFSRLSIRRLTHSMSVALAAINATVRLRSCCHVPSWMSCARMVLPTSSAKL